MGQRTEERELTAAKEVGFDATAVGVDIGGTNLRAAAVNAEGNVSHEVRLPTLADQGVESVLDQVRGAISQVVTRAQSDALTVSGIGIGCPGLVDTEHGIVRVPPNFPGWEEVSLGNIIRQVFRLPTVIANDVNAMAMGEFHHGAGRGFRDLICLTLGTGVGGACILDGRLHTGFLGTAGEIGHMTVEPHGPPCKCGNRGCLESLIGAQAIVARATEKLRVAKVRSYLSELDPSDMSPRLIAEAANKGDTIAREVLSEAGEYLGIVLAGLVNFLNPQAIIIGGGIAKAGDSILEPVKKVVRQRAYTLPAENVHIVPAQLGDRAGLIGAATLVFSRHQEYE